MRMQIGIGFLLAYIGCIFGANWAAQTWGLIDYPFGLTATAGTVFAGLSFTMRDFTQESLGRRWTAAAIIAGAFLSYWVAPSFALASGVAFLSSESLDFAVYTPLRERDWGTAVLASNIVGALVDSWLFLWIAFSFASAQEFWLDQTIIKIAMAAPFIVVIWIHRRATHRDLPVGLRAA